MKYKFKISLSQIQGKDLTVNSVYILFKFGGIEFKTETVSGSIDPKWRFGHQFEYTIEMRAIYHLREQPFVIQLCSSSPSFSPKLATISLSLLEVYHAQPRFMLPFPLNREKKATSSLTFDLSMELVYCGQIVIEAIDFIPAASLAQLEPTTTFLEYSFPSTECIYLLSRVAVSLPLHWERLDSLKIETTHSELMSGQVEILLKSSKIYQQGKHTTVGTCVIPINHYLTLSSTERIARFSEDVMANGSTVGVMSGTVIFVDIPSAVAGTKSQSSISLATSASYSDISRQLTKRDSRRNQTIDMGHAIPASISAKLQKQRESESKTTSSSLPLINPRVQTLTSRENMNTFTTSKQKENQYFQNDDPQELAVTPLSESYSSYRPDSPSVSQSELASPISSFQPEQISFDRTSPLEASSPPCGSVASSSYYSSYSPSRERTGRAGNDSSIHRNKSFFGTKRATRKTNASELSPEPRSSESIDKHSLQPTLEGYRTPQSSSPSTPSGSSSISEWSPLSALPQHAEAIHLTTSELYDIIPSQNEKTYFSGLANSGNTQHKQGYLTKQGKIVKNWKRRWFKLESVNGEMLLCYYRYPEDPKSRGKIKLGNYLSPDTHTYPHTNKQLCFRLRDSNRVRDYYICADTAASMEEWMHIIQCYTLHM